jgi:uncharacterized RDD family membrane protein YckC
LLDTLRYYETPEGIDLELHLAGLMPRIVAWGIDLLIQAVAYAVFASIFLLLGGGVGQGLALISFFLISWFYPVLFEIYHHGATPGKQKMGLRVVHDNGTPVGWFASLIRNLLRAVDFMPVMYGLGMLSLLVNRDFKRLGDLVAGTLVIYRENEQALHDIPRLSPRPLPVALTLSEQRALLNFAERSQHLSPQRQQELASILTPLTGQRDKQDVDTLLRYANWLNRG